MLEWIPPLLHYVWNSLFFLDDPVKPRRTTLFHYLVSEFGMDQYVHKQHQKYMQPCKNHERISFSKYNMQGQDNKAQILDEKWKRTGSDFKYKSLVGDRLPPFNFMSGNDPRKN